jgi:hypothetical protein
VGTANPLWLNENNSRFARRQGGELTGGPERRKPCRIGIKSLRGGASGVTPRPKVATPLDDWLVDLRLRRTRHQILDSLLWKLAVF